MTPSDPFLAVLATAGHVDHGKTTLVRALTGTDTDRLPEEQARGISIALGFAQLALPGGHVAFVDVPGHERFLRQMIAGAGGVGGVVIVIAADEGVMPQTREHLAVCALLGLRHALVVLTKTDLVTPAWRELVREDIRRTLAATPFRAAPLVPFSARNPATHAPVVSAIAELARTVFETQPRPVDRPFALPIDRVFSVHGFGTVVTGTTIAGTLDVGADVMWLPRGARARVRGLERFGCAIDRIGPGERVAVNLQGVAPDAIAPGDLLTTPDALVAAQSLDVTLHLAPGVTLAPKSTAIVHIGTAAVAATVVRLDAARVAAEPAHATPAAPGAIPAQLHLARPIGLFPGAPFVLRGARRRPESGTILAGGTAWLPAVRRANARTARAALATIEASARRDPAAAIPTYLAQLGEVGATAALLPAVLSFSAAAIDDALASRVAHGEVLATADRVYAWAALDPLEAALDAVLTEHHAAHPTSPGLRLDELRTRARPSADPELVASIALRAVVAKRWARDGAALRRANHQPSGHDQDPIALALDALIARADLAPPRPDELSAALLAAGHAATKPAVEAALRQLVAADRVVRVTPDLVVARAALTQLEVRVRAHFAHADTLDAQALKALTGASRKFAIPLGEWLDRARITYRTGDVRRLRGT